jgi:predicted GNAT family N-acyltransferase
MDYTVRFAATSEEREAAFAVRRQVFEVEQGIPRPLDRDQHDSNADHVVALDAGGRCIGTGRVVRLDNRTCQIGRLAVPAAGRGRGVGAALLAALERMARLRGLKEIVVHAQPAAEPFFANRGFVTEGARFLEQGVPHVLMRKQLVG